MNEYIDKIIESIFYLESIGSKKKNIIIRSSTVLATIIKNYYPLIDENDFKIYDVKVFFDDYQNHVTIYDKTKAYNNKDYIIKYNMPL